MEGNAPVKDSYLDARRLEARARGENSSAAWLEFAVLKAAKGSYALAAMETAGLPHDARCFLSVALKAGILRRRWISWSLGLRFSAFLFGVTDWTFQ